LAKRRVVLDSLAWNIWVILFLHSRKIILGMEWQQIQQIGGYVVVADIPRVTIEDLLRGTVQQHAKPYSNT
jgi:hypothetical protein